MLPVDANAKTAPALTAPGESETQPQLVTVQDHALDSAPGTTRRHAFDAAEPASHRAPFVLLSRFEDGEAVAEATRTAVEQRQGPMSVVWNERAPALE